jgi:hypothetical protein
LSSPIIDNTSTDYFRETVIHQLAALQPFSEGLLAEACKTSVQSLWKLLPEIAKPADLQNWQLTDESFLQLDPWVFPYKDDEHRHKAIQNALHAFDRMNIPEDDELWRRLVPFEPRGQGKSPSRPIAETMQ